MFGQNRLMGEEVSIFNGADFGTMATTQTRSALFEILATLLSTLLAKLSSTRWIFLAGGATTYSAPAPNSKSLPSPVLAS